MIAATYDFNLEQGTDYSFKITINDSDELPINLTGYSFASQARISFSSAEVSFLLNVTIMDQGTDIGKVIVSINREDTTALAITKTNTYLYDLEMTDDSDIRTRLIQGVITLRPEVTRD